MQIPAIIMAGGKGTRFNFKEINSEYDEKLLLKLGNKYIVEYVIDAVLASKKINSVFLAVSPYSTETKSIIGSKYKSIEIIDTPGKGFHSDIQYVIKKLKLSTTLIISGDIPLIKPAILDEIISKFFEFNKPSLSVMMDVNLFIKLNITPTTTFYFKNIQKTLVPLGINIIEGSYIDHPEIDQAILISEQIELLYNINTVEDFLQIKSIFNQI
ncbi:MAG: NTP transferase domain-containing protein [Promethearchaeota archaeon]